MKQRKRIILGFFLLGLLFFASCSRKIVGATPHRRDRHCGCENLRTTSSDSLFSSHTISFITLQK